jgi:uncharacterized radical SAM superfamily protein
MHDWQATVYQVEALEDIELDAELVAELQNAHVKTHHQSLDLFVPSFKKLQTSELQSCHTNRWPAISITGSKCKLQCDHCKAKILEPMYAAETPEELWRLVNNFVNENAQGILLTGGSNIHNVVEYDRFYSIIRRIKDEFPGFKIAMHTALVDKNVAIAMEQSGVDVAMMDVIGSQDTITQVYHLKRSVEDFEASLAALVSTQMRVVPHIVLGLHYGKLLGEWQALSMIQRNLPDALVLVVVMPQYAPAKRSFETPDPHQIGRFFLHARAMLADIPLSLGCARPPGISKLQIDAYATMAGLNGIAHPSDGIVGLAKQIDRKVRVFDTCCSLSHDNLVMEAIAPAKNVAVDQNIVRPVRFLSNSAILSSAG